MTVDDAFFRGYCTRHQGHERDIHLYQRHAEGKTVAAIAEEEFYSERQVSRRIRKVREYANDYEEGKVMDNIVTGPQDPRFTNVMLPADFVRSLSPKPSLQQLKLLMLYFGLAEAGLQAIIPHKMLITLFPNLRNKLPRERIIQTLPSICYHGMQLVERVAYHEGCLYAELTLVGQIIVDAAVRYRVAKESPDEE